MPEDQPHNEQEQTPQEIIQILNRKIDQLEQDNSILQKYKEEIQPLKHQVDDLLFYKEGAEELIKDQSNMIRIQADRIKELQIEVNTSIKLSNDEHYE